MVEYMKYRPPLKRKRISKPKKSRLQDVWESRIMEAESAKEKWKEDYQVEALESAYYGHQKPDDWQEDEWFSINLVASSAQVLRRNICPKDIIVNMNLHRSFLADFNMIPQLQKQVKIREAVIQNVFEGQEVFKLLRESWENSLYQFGVLKVGYSAEMLRNSNAGAILIDKEGKVVHDEKGHPAYEDTWVVEKEEFFIDRVDPDCFLVDKNCKEDLNRTGHWCSEKFFMSLEEARKEPYFDKKVVDKLGPSALEESEKLYLEKEKKYMTKWNWTDRAFLPEDELIVGYEIYDLKRAETLTIIRGAHDPVIMPSELPPGVVGHPYVTLKFFNIRGWWYPVPTIFNWMGPQMEYNYTRNRMSIHRRRFNRKYGYLDDSLDPEELDKLEHGGDGTLVRFNQAGAVEPIKDAPLDASYQFDTGVLRNEFMELTHVGQLQRSVAAADSATEAEIVERRGREGEVDEHEQVMMFASAVAKKLNDSMEANLTQEGAVRTVGPQGVLWIPFGPQHFEQLAGQILFSVEVSPASRVTLQVERAQLLQLLDLVAKNPLLLVNEYLLRQVFEQFPALRGNDMLIYQLMQLGALVLGAQQGPGSGGTQSKQIDEKSTGGEASASRKVASK